MSIREGKGGEGIAGRGEMCSSKNSFKKPCSKAIVQTGRHTQTIDRLLYLTTEWPWQTFSHYTTLTRFVVN